MVQEKAPFSNSKLFIVTVIVRSTISHSNSIMFDTF
jgi:hypothetical protein